MATIKGGWESCRKISALAKVILGILYKDKERRLTNASWARQKLRKYCEVKEKVVILSVSPRKVSNIKQIWIFLNLKKKKKKTKRASSFHFV